MKSREFFYKRVFPFLTFYLFLTTEITKNYSIKVAFIHT